MQTLERIRQELHQIIEEAAADVVRAQRPEEQVNAVVEDALERQRRWFIGLIDERLDQLNSKSSTGIVLRHLRGVVATESNQRNEQ